MNPIEKYLANAANVNEVSPGQEISVSVDLAFAHDGSASKVVKAFNELGESVKLDPEKFIVTFDHSLPAPSSEARADHKKVKEFMEEHGFKLFDHGEGILHQVIAERIKPSPGQIIIGADGHMLTSSAFGAVPFSVTPADIAKSIATGKYNLVVPETVQVEFTGSLPEGLSAKDLALKLLQEFGLVGLKGMAVIFTGRVFGELDINEKMTFCNMFGEMGIKTSLLFDDEKKYVDKVFTFDISSLKDLIAAPSSPANVKTAEELINTEITQVYIGGCTSGRLKDMEAAAEILKSRKVHSDVTLIVGPASSEVASKMEEEGYSKIIRDAGGIIISPGCGACSGIHQGTAGPDDAVLTTTVRNTPGRMGDEAAEIYLVSVKIAALSAISGKISLLDAVQI